MRFIKNDRKLSYAFIISNLAILYRIARYILLRNYIKKEKIKL